jgi:hypothetical protein
MATLPNLRSTTKLFVGLDQARVSVQQTDWDLYDTRHVVYTPRAMTPIQLVKETGSLTATSIAGPTSCAAHAAKRPRTPPSGTCSTRWLEEVRAALGSSRPGAAPHAKPPKAEPTTEAEERRLLTQ